MIAKIISFLSLFLDILLTEIMGFSQRLEARRETRRAKRAQYQAVQAKPGTWCDRHGFPILMFVNAIFIGIGIVMIIYATSALNNRFANAFGSGLAFTLLIAGILVILISILGSIGAKTDNKFLTLLYFLVVIAIFLASIIAGSMFFFAKDSLDAQFSDLWCDYADKSEGTSIQSEFHCCGYTCPYDRPAGGQCTFMNGTMWTPSASITCSADNAQAAGIAACAGVTDHTVHGLPGCRAVAIDNLKKKAAPVYTMLFGAGIGMLVAVFVAGRILCRKTGRAQVDTARGADKSAAQAHRIENVEAGGQQAPVFSLLVAEPAGPSTQSAGVSEANPLHGKA